MKRMLVLGIAALLAPLGVAQEGSEAPAAKEKPAARAERPDPWTRIQERFDLNKDGTVTWEEFQKVKSGFAMLDGDGDGALTEADAKLLMERRAERRAERREGRPHREGRQGRRGPGAPHGRHDGRGPGRFGRPGPGGPGFGPGFGPPDAPRGPGPRGMMPQRGGRPDACPHCGRTDDERPRFRDRPGPGPGPMGPGRGGRGR